MRRTSASPLSPPYPLERACLFSFWRKCCIFVFHLLEINFHRFQSKMDLLDFVRQSKTLYDAQLTTKIKVIGVIGKDHPDHGKGDNINSYLRENVFSVASSEEETCSIRAHYSTDEQILFLVMNGVSDVANLRKSLKKCSTNYFEAIAESELQEIRMLHFLFISCHFIIIFEQTSRIDVEFLRLLRRVNASRMRYRKQVNQRLVADGLRTVQFNNRILSPNDGEGRMVVPRVLLAFEKNNIRQDVNTVKKRELYEKLEKNLDSQFTDLLKNFELIDSGSSSLCQLNETIPCVHLLNPKIIRRDIVTEMFENLMAEVDNTKPPGNLQLASNNSFVKFLEDNFRSEKNEITLENVIELMKTLQCILDGSLEEKEKEITVMQDFLAQLRQDNLFEAKRMYTNDTSEGRRGFTDLEPVKIRTKEEHMRRFNDATHFIESVVGINSKEILAEMQATCNDLWHSDMRACESISMMGHPCVKKVHPTYGDQTAPESRWTPHDAANTLVSTCVCGRKQLIRQEPFSVKEANFDFYEHPDFQCCKRLWRFQFQLYREDGEDEIMWADRESNSLRAAKKMAQQEDELAEVIDELDIPESLQGSLSPEESSQSDEDVRIEMASSADSSDSEMIGPSSRHQALMGSPSKTERELAVEHAKRILKLENTGKSEDFILGVPNSLTAGKLPIFPSFYLTALGDASMYNHGSGLKNQPNFKIGGDYLTPTVVFLDSAQRATLGDVLKSELPIRRPCTCRKPPLKSAQLQKIHVVTPKAPVHITLDPKIVIPGHEGVYGTGQEPLELHHSKYYILHLPAVYSGPSGTWIPEDYNPNREGKLMGGALKIVYKPVFSFRW
ncbi:hypothetical protein CAEBREN_08954 [Caenorhabditis brenneri]|uniref:Nonsense-mediated mRNA decay factor SMG8 n=1 Tax=Caenorhabditis brenneri TaxID=135651 RepID=G0MMW3_CAEBE|nr:hypothetical protein CAEBREN_08954 [Caenorhabditis brenneri]